MSWAGAGIWVGVGIGWGVSGRFLLDRRRGGASALRRRGKKRPEGGIFWLVRKKSITSKRGNRLRQIFYRWVIWVDSMREKKEQIRGRVRKRQGIAFIAKRLGWADFHREKKRPTP